MFDKVSFAVLDLKPNNRMVRIGLGQHKGLWFARIDLWWKGFRISRAEDKT